MDKDLLGLIRVLCTGLACWISLPLCRVVSQESFMSLRVQLLACCWVLWHPIITLVSLFFQVGSVALRGQDDAAVLGGEACEGDSEQVCVCVCVCVCVVCCV